MVRVGADVERGVEEHTALGAGFELLRERFAVQLGIDVSTCQPIMRPEEGGRPKTKPTMIPDEEYEYYSRPEHEVPRGPPLRRTSRLSEAIPVRFPPGPVEEIRRRVTDDARSVSSWIRRAVEHELQHPA